MCRALHAVVAASTHLHIYTWPQGRRLEWRGNGIGAMSKIDVPALKKRVDLCELASRYTTLKPWGRSGELAGPCPQARCTADEDGFHVHPDGWWKWGWFLGS